MAFCQTIYSYNYGGNMNKKEYIKFENEDQIMFLAPIDACDFLMLSEDERGEVKNIECVFFTDEEFENILEL